MPLSKLPFELKQFLHFSGLKRMKGADALLVDGTYLRHYFDPQPGQRIYHYTSLTGAEGVLESGKLWLSEYSKTNDKSEFTFAKEKFVETIQRVGDRYDARVLARYHNELGAFETRHSMLLGCFTESRDDLAQWDRYADRARGCVLGFNSYWFWKHKGVQLRRVVYDQEYLDHLVEANLSILEWAQRHVATEDVFRHTMLGTLFVLEQFCFKDQRFVSEAEVRMLRAVQVSEGTPNGLEDMAGLQVVGMRPRPPLIVPLDVKLRNGAYGPTRYVEVPYSYKTWSALRSVGFGPKCSEADERRIREKFTHLPGIEFWKSDLPLR